MRILFALLVFVTASAFTPQRETLRPPRVETVGEGSVWRVAGDVPGSWKEVSITNVFGFKRAPLRGSKVTIVPLDVDVPVIELAIRKIKKGGDCDGAEGKGDWWEVELDEVKQAEFFSVRGAPNGNAEVPFDVIVIYPAVKFARQIKRDQLKRSMLPAAVTLNTVKGAVDLTGDGLPDVLQLEYCCLDPQKPAAGCDLICGKTYLKIGSVWKLLDTSSPC